MVIETQINLVLIASFSTIHTWSLFNFSEKLVHIYSVLSWVVQNIDFSIVLTTECSHIYVLFANLIWNNIKTTVSDYQGYCLSDSNTFPGQGTSYF